MVTAFHSGGHSAFKPSTDVMAKEFFWGATDYNADMGSYRVRNIGGSGAHNFTFRFPVDFGAIVKLCLLAIPSAGAAGAARDIDLFSDYAAPGEPFNNHTQSDTTSTYDLTGTSGEIFELDIAPLFTSASAFDVAGIEVDHNAIGGAIEYLGVLLRYT